MARLLVLLTFLLSACAVPPGAVVSRGVNVPSGAGGDLNAYRKAAGLPALRHHPLLDAAAHAHAADMMRHDSDSHRGSDGSDPRRRIRAAGYAVCGTTENIAWEMGSRAAAMQGWMASPGHRRNMLNPVVRDYGYAIVGTKQVLVMARPC